MNAGNVRAVRVLLTAASMLVFIGAAASSLLISSTPAQADGKCTRCGDLGSQCKSGCGHTPGSCPCKTFTADKGPSHIEGSVLASYPRPLQETYEKVFSKRCSKCHTLARPINTDFTPTKWEEYVKKMMRKPGSGIKTEDAKRVWQFLVYDTAKRKPSVAEKAPPSDREIFNRVVHEGGS
jgi:hypothetical protein